MERADRVGVKTATWLPCSKFSAPAILRNLDLNLSIYLVFCLAFLTEESIRYSKIKKMITQILKKDCTD
ncbi:MAG: hypothetical protein A2X87_00405 [Deltaproteobacteria bacterium GWC2_42_51]|nr:MAG: hypothetical protein A2056_01135 [Deltaproteobacteria bacterium GWA2_42_85]OGP30943.1 MAG: hypothetical protein A2067_05035 [Deltaproteobacteria bacterium GWB2_42_7]OGP36440.1 MAG: hypothetical protein A2X87_00405 [Deltaproteobacteria bacterium GWC2_42_51]OGP39782.1 MAG: hypothetical protein A2090_04640 [Deltaproteobacteria bacterium GWD2_42_10]OGP48600.1 MAG: hypothetical protein A2022_11200 [Deltaproteobacteria bacterium GWF2_42_12]OGQ29435.1 MAG: hypothetical protein A3D29_01715 [De